MNTLKQKYKTNEVVVNNKSNFKSHLVKCQAIMDNMQFDKLILRAMGKATVRATNLATQLNLNNYNTFDLEEKAYTVEVVEDKQRACILGVDKDEFDPDSIEPKDKRVIQISAVEIIVRKSKLELGKIQKARDLFEVKKR